MSLKKELLTMNTPHISHVRCQSSVVRAGKTAKCLPFGFSFPNCLQTICLLSTFSMLLILVKLQFSFFLFFFFFFWFLGPHSWHTEVPRLGVHSGVRLPAYTTAHGKAGSLTQWVRPGVKPATSWLLVRFVSTVPRWEVWSFLSHLVQKLCLTDF